MTKISQRSMAVAVMALLVACHSVTHEPPSTKPEAGSDVAASGAPTTSDPEVSAPVVTGLVTPRPPQSGNVQLRDATDAAPKRVGVNP
ncbi:MAG TPA: hypothetical protein VIV60_01695, partial [Polyangiaceae bacterium]